MGMQREQGAEAAVDRVGFVPGNDAKAETD